MTLRTFLDETATRYPGRPAQRFHDGREWVFRTFAALRDRAAEAASAIPKLGIEPGRTNVALMLENGPEWQEIYLGLAGSGVAVVPIDPKLRAGEALHILADSEAVAIFAGAKLAGLLSAVAGSLPKLKTFVFIGGPAAIKDRVSIAYETLMAQAATALESARAWFGEHRPGPADVASIIYTSGTTGLPKGAMLTHGAFTSSIESTLRAVRNCRFGPHDDFLNVLPLFHAFAFAVNFIAPLRLGAASSFIRSLRTLAEDMKALRPTVLFAVPLLAEKMYAKITASLAASRAARFLQAVGLRALVNRGVRAGLGGKLRFIGIGGAPTAVLVLKGLQRLGFQVLEGYGLTECAPGVAYPDLDYYVPGTVGRVLDCMQYKLIAPDSTGAGELAVRGPNILIGYYNDPDATAEAIDPEGYFHTGDLVRLDAAGNVTVCGRRKALIVNREGKNIYPEEIEQLIEHRCPEIKDVICLGYREKPGEIGEHVGLLAVPDPDCGKSEAEILAGLRALLRAELAEYKLPRKIVFRRELLERTGTLKVRRSVYAHALDESAAIV